MTMSDKQYVIRLVLVLVCIVGAMMIASRSLFSLDVPYRSEDVLRQYQLSKLASRNDVQTVIVGDSSAGNAIDAEEFTRLSGTQTANLALTASYGFTGAYNMVRHALLTQPNLETILIVATPDIWRREVSRDGYIHTLNGLPLDSLTSVFGRTPLEAWQYEFNPKQLYWYLRYLVEGTLGTTEFSNDYIRQSPATYANGERIVEVDVALSPVLHHDKMSVLRMLGALCKTEHLKCVFMHGPMHATVYGNSTETLNKLTEELTLLSGSGIEVAPDFFVYANEHMGDSKDHIDTAFKMKSTEDYWSAFEEYLTSQERAGSQ